MQLSVVGQDQPFQLQIERFGHEQLTFVHNSIIPLHLLGLLDIVYHIHPLSRGKLSYVLKTFSFLFLVSTFRHEVEHNPK
tara:strand:- start:1770 stop:2009 length:240 start_codon:yes stop_codon:yes gene_type:complete